MWKKILFRIKDNTTLVVRKPQLLQCAFIVTNTRADFAFERAKINEISESALYKIVNNSESITLEEKFFTLFESPYFPLHD